jgi:hypothetical protein
VRYNLIEGHPDYRVGDDGSVWSRKSGEWKPLKPHPQKRGHCAVDLGRRSTRYVHHLVLEAFVGLCPEGQECRHLDGNPGNNRLGNLAWGTRLENMADRYRHDAVPMKLSDDQVRFARANVDPSRRDGMAVSLAKEWDVTPALIYQIVSGKMRRSVV